MFRYADATGHVGEATTPTASTDHIAGVRNERGNVVGLMPHPEHAVDPDVGPTGGQPLFASLLAQRSARAAERRERAAAPAGSASPTTSSSASARPSAASPNRPSSRCTRRCGPSTASYKSSKVHLRTLPTEGSAVLVGPGQDAGAVDVGDGIAAVFKMESHSHPSAIEPYQGAATGVGGIVRDIISMGARPVALLDPLMFGPLTEARNRWLLEGVVAGIGGYGNCIGVPTVGGEIRFAEPHSANPTVERDVRGNRPGRRARDAHLAHARTSARSWCSTAPRPGATASAA